MSPSPFAGINLGDFVGGGGERVWYRLLSIHSREASRGLMGAGFIRCLFLPVILKVYPREVSLGVAVDYGSGGAAAQGS